ncbi:unnamed protein product [Protopolystoma xenopodis]|uniref:Uncharacterized protein n=1 Tax=Protopolystoma xenopodis TaxID=117903 RepID=A0A448XB49_9PLAT|nr:unnamed protein product [Protopolystoma xenopodis]
MMSRYDDVRHITDESPARIHRGHRAVLRGPFAQNYYHTSKAILLRLPVRPTYESFPSASSCEMKVYFDFAEEHAAVVAAAGEDDAGLTVVGPVAVGADDVDAVPGAIDADAVDAVVALAAAVGGTWQFPGFQKSGGQLVQ